MLVGDCLLKGMCSGGQLSQEGRQLDQTDKRCGVSFTDFDNSLQLLTSSLFNLGSRKLEIVQI